MQKIVSSIAVAGVGLVLSAAAFAAHPAAAPAKKNPVVSLTGRLHPGLWQTTIHGSHDGKPVTSRSNHDCITAADLKDFLNSGGDNPTVRKYSLHGNHLYIEAAGGTSPMTLVENIYIDDADHMHGTIKVHGTYEIQGKKHTIDSLTKITSRRISATCPKSSDD